MVGPGQCQDKRLGIPIFASSRFASTCEEPKDFLRVPPDSALVPLHCLGGDLPCSPPSGGCIQRIGGSTYHAGIATHI